MGTVLTALTPEIRSAALKAMRSAARAAAAHVGGGDGDAVDAAAVRVLRAELGGLPIDGVVVVGEGEKDQAPMLFVGERIGRGGSGWDVAVDPVDGTRLAAAGQPGAMVVLALAPRGGLADIGAAHYLRKLVTRVDDDRLSAAASVADTLGILSERLGRDVAELTVAVQDRPRNAALAQEVVAAGARLDSFVHGDVERSLRVLLPGSGLDALVGIGGAPEGVITAVVARALGGGMRASLAPQSRREAGRIREAGLDEGELSLDALCSADGWMAAASVTGIDLGARTLPPVGADGSVAVWASDS